VAAVNTEMKGQLYMNELEKTMYGLTGQGVIKTLSSVMSRNYPEFTTTIPKYKRAVEELRRLLPENGSPTVDDYLAAQEKNIISRVAAAGYLGYRVNLEHFHHPVQIDFVRLDTIDYLKDHIIGHFPQNHESSVIMETFRSLWKGRYEKLIEDIDEYYIYMELTGPKLAHYAGYIIANHLLPWVEPGYCADPLQTMRFAEETKKYVGFLPL